MVEKFKPFITKITVREFDQWAPKVIDLAQGDATHKVCKDELEKIKKDAFDEAYREGLAQADNDVLVMKNQLSTVIRKLLDPLKLLDEEVSRELVEIIIMMTKKCLQVELSLNPEKISTVLEEIKQYLPIASSHRKLYLSPSDAGPLSDVLTDVDLGENEIIEDPNLSPGEYRYITETAELDGRVSTRMKNILDKINDDDGVRDE